MSERCYLKPGEMFFGESTLVETLLGSCVAITLWYPHVRKGGICHFMLPQRQRDLRSHSRDLDGRYGREAWLWLLQQSRAQCLQPELAEIKLFGGSRVLQLKPEQNFADIGAKNIELAEDCLQQAGLQPCARDVGGDGHRVLRFDLRTGYVWVRRGEALPNAVLKEMQP